MLRESDRQLKSAHDKNSRGAGKIQQGDVNRLNLWNIHGQKNVEHVYSDWRGRSHLFTNTKQHKSHCVILLPATKASAGSAPAHAMNCEQVLQSLHLPAAPLVSGCPCGDRLKPRNTQRTCCCTTTKPPPHDLLLSASSNADTPGGACLSAQLFAEMSGLKGSLVQAHTTPPPTNHQRSSKDMSWRCTLHPASLCSRTRYREKMASTSVFSPWPAQSPSALEGLPQPSHPQPVLKN